MGLSDVVWRRVKDHSDHLVWDSDEDRWLPRPNHPSNALQFDDDGLSTVWKEHVEQVHSAGPAVAADSLRGYTLVYGIDVEYLHKLNLKAAHTPVDKTLPDCAHASVTATRPLNKPERREVRFQLSTQMKLVFGNPTTVPPPGA